jgi:hypothetical protein
MSERVSIIPGKYSTTTLLVVPRGANDVHLCDLAERCAEELECYALINRGFEKSEQVDVMKDQADCGRISHIQQEVVYEEFLEPIKHIKERMVNRIVRSNLSQGNWGDIDNYVGRFLIFYLYGVSDNVHSKANEPVSVIVGNGGKILSSHYTCEEWRRDLFIHTANEAWDDTMGSAYVGHPRGKYAGRSSDNINQFFRMHETDRFVESMQLSFPMMMRSDEQTAKLTGEVLGQIISKLLVQTEFDEDIDINFI